MASALHSSVKEAHEIWFSYAVNDEDLVQGISDNVSRGQEHFSDSQNDLSSYQHLKDVHLVPQKYKLLDEKNAAGEPVYRYRLKGGDHISELSIDIASSLLKVVVLSKSYFKSPACLEELCLCLCSNHCESNVYPLVIIAEPEGKNILSDNYTFQIPKISNKASSDNSFISSESIPTTLAGAMKQTFEYLIERYNILPGFNLQPKSLQDFEQKISNLSETIFFNVSKKGNQNEHKNIALEAYRKALKLINNTRKTNHLEYINTRFKEIIRTEPIKTLISDHPEEGIDIASKFNSISNFSKAGDFVELINKGLDNIRKELHKKPTKQILGELCSLVHIKSLQSTRAQLFAHFKKINSIISVTELNSNEPLVRELFTAIAHSLTFEKTFSFEDKWNHENIANVKVPGLINAQYQTSSPNEKPSDDLLRIISNLIEGCAPEILGQLPDNIEALKNNDELLEEIAEYIDDEIRNARNIKALVVSSEQRNYRGSHALIQEIELLFQNENVELPVIELKPSIHTRDSTNSIPPDTLFIKKDYGSLKKSLKNLYQKCFELTEAPK